MNKNIRSVLAVPFVLAIVLLSGCSGHPGAGTWELAQDSMQMEASQYSALELMFDGKGTLHPNKLAEGQADQSDLWCVWQAKSAMVLDVQCGADNEGDAKTKFELVVTGDKQEGVFEYSEANLLQENHLVSVFKRKK